MAQSINPSNFYGANIPGVVTLRGTTTDSLLNSKVDEVVPWHQQAIGHAGVYEGKAVVKDMRFEICPKGYKWRSWMDRQWEVDPKGSGTRVKCSCAGVSPYPRDRRSDRWTFCPKIGTGSAWVYFATHAVLTRIITQHIAPEQCWVWQWKISRQPERRIKIRKITKLTQKSGENRLIFTLSLHIWGLTLRCLVGGNA